MPDTYTPYSANTQFANAVRNDVLIPVTGNNLNTLDKPAYYIRTFDTTTNNNIFVKVFIRYDTEKNTYSIIPYHSNYNSLKQDNITNIYDIQELYEYNLKEENGDWETKQPDPDRGGKRYRKSKKTRKSRKSKKTKRRKNKI